MVVYMRRVGQIFAALVLAACSYDVHSLENSDGAVISVGMTMEEVEAVWGEPTTNRARRIEIGDGTVWKYDDGTKLVFRNSRLQQIFDPI